MRLFLEHEFDLRRLIVEGLLEEDYVFFKLLVIEAHKFSRIKTEAACGSNLVAVLLKANFRN